jgi:hypothetical protein
MYFYWIGSMRTENENIPFVTRNDYLLYILMDIRNEIKQLKDKIEKLEKQK